MFYANGCSFTEGFGLEDPEDAWPYKLAQKMGYDIDDIHTEAHRGVSNQYIVRSTIASICKLQAMGHDISFVAIGMTAPARREWFSPKLNRLYHDIPAFHYEPNEELDGFTNNEFKVFNELYLKHFYSPVYDFHLYMTHLLTLQNFLKANDIDYIIFNSLSLTENLVEESTFKELIDQLGVGYMWLQFDQDKLYTDQTMFKFAEEKGLLIDEDEDVEGYMHPNKEGHLAWADILMQDITAKMMKKQRQRKQKNEDD